MKYAEAKQRLGARWDATPALQILGRAEYVRLNLARYVREESKRERDA